MILLVTRETLSASCHSGNVETRTDGAKLGWGEGFYMGGGRGGRWAEGIAILGMQFTGLVKLR